MYLIKEELDIEEVLESRIKKIFEISNKKYKEDIVRDWY